VLPVPAAAELDHANASTTAQGMTTQAANRVPVMAFAGAADSGYVPQGRFTSVNTTRKSYRAE
jgi:hypothetical protein